MNADTDLTARVDTLERTLSPQPPQSAEAQAAQDAWRADLVAKGIAPPDGATAEEARIIAAVNARKVEFGR